MNNKAPGIHFRRPVEAKVLRAEVATHYLALFNGDRLHRAVEQGVRAGRAWCDQQGIAYTPIDRSDFYDTDVALRFSDRLHGRLRGRPAEADLRLHVADAGAFMNTGCQRVDVRGTVTSSVLDGAATVEEGYADILLDVRSQAVPVQRGGVQEADDGVDPTRKRMSYVLHLRTPTGRPVTFLGVKDVTSATVRRAAREAMTMSCRVLDGWVGPDDAAPELATGLLWMGFRDVAAQLVGARADGPSLKAEAAGLARYGALFAGSLWDVAARKVLTYAPF
jgi:hypothetical protein